MSCAGARSRSRTATPRWRRACTSSTKARAGSAGAPRARAPPRTTSPSRSTTGVSSSPHEPRRSSARSPGSSALGHVRRWGGRFGTARRPDRRLRAQARPGARDDDGGDGEGRDGDATHPAPACARAISSASSRTKRSTWACPRCGPVRRPADASSDAVVDRAGSSPSPLSRRSRSRRPIRPIRPILRRGEIRSVPCAFGTSPRWIASRRRPQGSGPRRGRVGRARVGRIRRRRRDGRDAGEEGHARVVPSRGRGGGVRGGLRVDRDGRVQSRVAVHRVRARSTWESRTPAPRNSAVPFDAAVRASNSPVVQLLVRDDAKPGRGEGVRNGSGRRRRRSPRGSSPGRR